MEKIKVDEQYKEFYTDLCKLNKIELIDLIHNYWVGLRQEADRDINNFDHHIAEFGRIKMTQVNRLKILAKIKSKFK